MGTIAETTLRSATAEGRLIEAGLTLPKAAGAVAAYEPWVIVDKLLITSGQLPWVDGDLKFRGKIGSDLTPEQGYKACQLSMLNAIAQLKDAAGNLEAIKRIVRLEGTLNVAPGFTATPRVLNGASDLVNAIFGERGRHTRMIYTNPEMPLDCASLVVMWAELE
jgi:enamine deaminase RidA (YjgF/YER057c/UK114 family)